MVVRSLTITCLPRPQDGWTSEDVQAWFKKCGNNIDQVIQYYTSMWANTDNDLSTVCANTMAT